MKILEKIKDFLNQKPPVLNICKEFEKKFGIRPEKFSEYKAEIKENGSKSIKRVYITHEFETENYAKIFVLSEVVEDDVLEEILENYIALLTISLQKAIYYETFIKKI